MKKFKFVFALIMIGYLSVVLSLFRIQFLTTNYADSIDYVRKNIITAKRGTLYDKNGAVLTGSLSQYDLSVDPLFFKPSDNEIKKIADILEIEIASVEARLTSGSSRWAMLGRDISMEKYLALRTLGLSGLFADQTLLRVYPEASLAGTLTGFVGKNESGTQIGYYGVEGYYEAELKGLDGYYEGERDPAARPIFFGYQDQLSSQDGRDVYLTIDKSVQQITKTVAVKGFEQFLPKELCIVVADPSTMAILALTCLPDYDPRIYQEFPEYTYRNSIISDMYEPGSTFKPIIVASALEQDAISPTDNLPEGGPLTVGDYQIRTWDNKYRDSLSISDILAKSSNVGMVRIGEKMGNDGVYKTVSHYGFGQLTGIDLQGEVLGAVRPRQNWYPIDYATATFGQGLAVTPIQLLTAFSSIINGGELLEPYVVAKMSDGIKTSVHPRKTVVRRVLSDKNSAVMRKMLEYTVDNAEYRWQKPAGYRFGGKTGTAQIPIEGRYDASRTIASFVGFAPVDNPRFIALVILKESSISSWGSETAAPLFFDLAKELIAYYNIPPEY
ncbi:MAG TPA: penicillin-binding protein 2 [Candidatus Woesebacteria bacterium]|nr:penicillin-binding protein 2 [Candidatus Woesebacteria bacterium]HNS94613.1 penicillin-binding protein 2 [Candidatus Woesebacteria bacterium]